MSSNKISPVVFVDDHRNILANYDYTKNISNARITKYEKSEIMGQRTTQLQNNAVPLVELDPTKKYTIRQIVEMEYQQGYIPFIIQREVGDNHVEYWKFRDLIRD